MTNQQHVSFLKVLLFSFFVFLGGCADRPKFSVETVPEYNALFYRENGWTGADIAFSVPLTDNKTLWLFGDTWIGKIRAGKHVDSAMVNNTIAIQEGKDPVNANLEFYYPVNHGKPSPFITPLAGKGFFWLDHGGIVTKKGLFLFMNRVIKPLGNGSVWDFKSVGLTMACIRNPEDHPSQWRIIQRNIPWIRFSPNGNEIIFGQPLLKADGMIYIYGLEVDVKARNRYLVLARVKDDRLEDFNDWAFYFNGKWQADFTKASRLADRFGAELSVSYQPAIHKYVAVYTELGLSKNIMIRFAPAPEGPWSKPHVVYVCPEMDWSRDYFCYAAKGHPELSVREDELLITYACNANDFWKMASDARIYWPKFLRVRFQN